MSMSTGVVGFHPPDEKWLKMKAIWDSCAEAGINPPNEVQEFFDWGTPEEQGVEVNLDDCAEEYTSDMQSGFEIEVDKIPKNVKVIRFYNSW